VGEPVLSEVREAFGPEIGEKLLPIQEDGSRNFDLWGAIYHTLLLAGVLPENIEVSEYCSMCNQDTFFSYRAATPEMKGRQGNYGAMIMLA
jgi:copper oxidase (laccase) domain-containing protein